MGEGQELPGFTFSYFHEFFFYHFNSFIIPPPPPPPFYSHKSVYFLGFFSKQFHSQKTDPNAKVDEVNRV